MTELNETEVSEREKIHARGRALECNFTVESATSLRLITKEAGDYADKARMCFSIRAKHNREVTLSTGASLSSIKGVVTFKVRVNEDTAKDSVAGYLEYTEEYHDDYDRFPQAYWINIFISDAEFNRILDVFLAGKTPSSISINVHNMKYGTAPDGSEKKWDITETKIAKISSFYVDFSLQEEKVEEKSFFEKLFG